MDQCDMTFAMNTDKVTCTVFSFISLQSVTTLLYWTKRAMFAQFHYGSPSSEQVTYMPKGLL